MILPTTRSEHVTGNWSKSERRGSVACRLPSAVTRSRHTPWTVLKPARSSSSKKAGIDATPFG